MAQTTLGKTILKSTLGKTASKFIPVIGQALFAYEIVTFIGGILGNNDDKAIELLRHVMNMKGVKQKQMLRRNKSYNKNVLIWQMI